MGIGIIGLVVLAVIVLVVASLANREGGRTVLAVVGGIVLLGVVGVMMIGAVLFMGTEVSFQESNPMSEGDESSKYERRTTVVREDLVASEKRRRDIELIPSPDDDSESTNATSLPPTETDAGESSEPDWVRKEDSSSLGDSLAVVSDGPRPTQSECREAIQAEIANSVIAYADAHDLPTLAGQPNLLTDEVLKDVVRDEYFATSPHEFNGKQQTWYTLHQLLEFDSDVQDQLAQLNDRAVVNERLIITGAAAAGVFGLLGLAFVVLKTVEAKNTTSNSRETSAEWRIGFQSAEEARGMGPVIAAVAAVVVLLIGLVFALG